MLKFKPVKLEEISDRDVKIKIKDSLVIHSTETQNVERVSGDVSVALKNINVLHTTNSNNNGNLCGICNKNTIHHIHHIDLNNKNSKLENLQGLCTLCHAEIHGIEPKLSELKTLVTLRDRLIIIKGSINNQIRGFGGIELVVPTFWRDESKRIDDKIIEIEKQIKKEVTLNSKWKWLSGIRGVSYVNASKLIALIPPENFKTVSKMWRYCGLDANYIRRKKKITKEESKKYGNPYVKKELLGIIASNFIRAKSDYKKIYDEEKEKQLANELKRMHAHRRAIRIMIREFLLDWWKQGRNGEKIEGIEKMEESK